MKGEENQLREKGKCSLNRFGIGIKHTSNTSNLKRNFTKSEKCHTLFHTSKTLSKKTHAKNCAPVATPPPQSGEL